MVGADDLAAEARELRGEDRGEAGAVGLLVVDDVDLLLLRVVEEVLGGELALDDVRGAGAEVGLEDALGVALAPVVALAEGGVGVGGETWAMSAFSKTPCMDWATPEFSGPTAPRTSLLPTSLVALACPEAGTAWSSRASILNSMPGTSLFLFAVLAARSTEFLMPWPSAERDPVSGASTPMTTVVLLPLSLLPLLSSSRDPQAVRVSAPVVSTVVRMSKERCRTKGPFPGAASSAEVP